jgi:hypothetical protein
MADLATIYLADILDRFTTTRTDSERAAAQVDDDAFFRTPSAEVNSIAVTMKHVGGNLASRFADFLTTDGEKPTRDRDNEFEIAGSETRADIEAIWTRGWNTLTAQLEALRPEDLTATVTIRGHSLYAVEALDRSLAHISYHSGQIVQLAKHWTGSEWKTLTIPRGGSGAFNAAAMREPR